MNVKDMSDLFSEQPYYISNEDCVDFLRQIPDDSVDLVLTDPPYNLGQFVKDRKSQIQTMRPNFFGAAGWDNLDFDTWQASMDKMFSEVARIAKVGASMIVFMSVLKVITIIELAERHGFYYKTTGVWHKTNPMPRNMNYHFINSLEPWIYFVYKKKTGTFNNDGKCIHDFLETPITPKKERHWGGHPTQKPLVLLKDFVTLLSNKDDVVLDPFMGSGSSGVAAVMSDRKFIGCELNPEYYETSKKRLNDAIAAERE